MYHKSWWEKEQLCKLNNQDKAKAYKYLENKLKPASCKDTGKYFCFCIVNTLPWNYFVYAYERLYMNMNTQDLNWPNWLQN